MKKRVIYIGLSLVLLVSLVGNIYLNTMRLSLLADNVELESALTQIQAQLEQEKLNMAELEEKVASLESQQEKASNDAEPIGNPEVTNPEGADGSGGSGSNAPGTNGGKTAEELWPDLDENVPEGDQTLPPERQNPNNYDKDGNYIGP